MPIVQGTEIKSIAQHIAILRKDPTLGRQTLVAEATWNGTNLSSRVVPNDTIQGSGGECLYAEDLLEILACCVVNDIIGYGAHEDVEAARAHVRVEGDLDFGGSLGLGGPAGFKALRVDVSIDTNATGKEVENLMGTVRKSSIVAQSLGAVPQSWAVKAAREVAA